MPAGPVAGKVEPSEFIGAQTGDCREFRRAVAPVELNSDNPFDEAGLVAVDLDRLAAQPTLLAHLDIQAAAVVDGAEVVGRRISALMETRQ